MARNGIIGAGSMLVDHVQRISHWPEQGWLTEIHHSEKCSGGAALNVLFTLARMQVNLPLAAVGMVGEDSDGEYIVQRLDEHHIDRQFVQQTRLSSTAMTQVMTAPDGQRTFFHARGANAQLDLAHFAAVVTPHRIFHLGYLLLLDSLDVPDDDYGTRSARLLAQMQQRGYLTSLDLVSRAGEYRPLVLPALRWLDYLVINELEAQSLTGVQLRTAHGLAAPEAFAVAAAWLMQQGVRQRVVIHAPEGAWGQQTNGEGRWQPAWCLTPEEIVGSVGAGDAFCAGVLYASHEGWSLAETLKLAHTCASFNLHAANALDGTRPLAEMQRWMDQAICVSRAEEAGRMTSAEKT
ncbi:carbohydrate kinase family protein [Candidatus Pantoea floridensis]|uniref:Sugar or nucleoside kinase, ribokinase family n=1 Tax=Candidatus Pantoea floridensis TaxID=1938870 RepID=A0A286BY37_9GAMM|nr:carbohydrate kinase family protein [Pantoea floridensis]PIF21497.1 sugar/nucleoside kinase (ribokinase family) [Enterobacteriaceae bacterium JKS000233]SOD39008.1 Sugar or nucleoside kinase, ribokinase family [Pantoea floridensis]